MKKLLIAVMVLALSLPGLASALTYSPTLDDLNGWQALVGTSPSNTFNAEKFATGVKYDGRIYGSGPEPSQGYLWIGKTYDPAQPLNLTGYDKFALNVYNDNENTWNYAIFLMDNTSGFFPVSVPFPTPIAKDTGANLEIDLKTMAEQGFDLANVGQIGLLIEAIVPIAGYDRVYETMVAPVPEPGTMMLLGAGFLGLAIYGKRRRNA